MNVRDSKVLSNFVKMIEGGVYNLHVRWNKFIHYMRRYHHGTKVLQRDYLQLSVSNGFPMKLNGSFQTILIICLAFIIISCISFFTEVSVGPFLKFKAQVKMIVYVTFLHIKYVMRKKCSLSYK